MKIKIFVSLVIIIVLATAILARAEEEARKDLATGEGLMLLPSSNANAEGTSADEYLKFEPRYGYAYAQGQGSDRRVWLLMTGVDASGLDWRNVADRVETLRQWCETQKSPFVLVELDGAGTPQLLSQCPGNGALAVEMISVINGLPSVDVRLEINDGTRLRGMMLGGTGNCGDMKYCEQTKEYYFDVTIDQ